MNDPRPAPRPWTAKERQYLRDHYGKQAWPHRQTVKVIAAALGRTPRDVSRAAFRFGVTDQREPERLPRRCSEQLRKCHRRLRAAHARGWTDHRIARSLGVAHKTVVRWREKLGLPRNPLPAAERTARAKRLKQVGRAHGFRTLGALSVQSRRLVAARLGWPQAMNGGDARLLDCLAAKPGATRLELQARLGRGRNTVQGALQRLKRQGLVVAGSERTPRYRLAPGMGKHQPAPGKPQPVPHGEGVSRRTATFHAGREAREAG